MNKLFCAGVLLLHGFILKARQTDTVRISNFIEKSICLYKERNFALDRRKELTGAALFSDQALSNFVNKGLEKVVLLIFKSPDKNGQNRCRV
ncbi:MAG: hypothetical protein P0Y53_08500 [Candidatus Pseudobacter hemicellulosilyticus]|uniref:Uncharacterized protein n=1 Tax=Candidatus Pseudobacter hemicellulosilyticus TaxID=3121375 RepID=A0AAJ5WSQ9_9BACT|nr:MAG: hypothetical protein P0Y53_08500 [Pseudobacter sp.]